MAVAVTKATGKAAKLGGKQVAVRLLRSTHVTRRQADDRREAEEQEPPDGDRPLLLPGLVARTVAA